MKPEIDKIDLGCIIRKQRTEKHMTQQELAGKLNISYQLLQKYEYNKCRPPLERLITICGTLSIDLEELLQI